MEEIPASQPNITTPTSSNKRVYIIVGVVLLLLTTALISWFLVNRSNQPAVPTPTTKPVVNQPVETHPLNTFPGTIESISAQSITAKNVTETKTFTLATNLSIQKTASNSAVNTMTAPINLKIADLKTGDKVMLLIDKDTSQVKTILMVN